MHIWQQFMYQLDKLKQHIKMVSDAKWLNLKHFKLETRKTLNKIGCCQ